MEYSQSKRIKNRINLILFVFVGIALNILPSIIRYFFNLPLWLDTAGTIMVAAVAGFFPGVLTAVATSIIITIYVSNSVYYTLVGVLIAITATILAPGGRFLKKRMVLLFILIIALYGGILGTVIEWALIGGSGYPAVEETSKILAESTGIDVFFSTIVVDIVLNIADKLITTVIAIILMNVISDRVRDALWNSAFMQKPLTKKQIKGLRRGFRKKNGSIQRQLITLMLFMSIILTLVFSVISLSLYSRNLREVYMANACQAAKFAADELDPAMMDIYLTEGRSAFGYEKMEKILYSIRDNSTGVKFLYVIKIKRDGCYVIFDLDNEDTPAEEPGSRIEFEEAFEPYLDTLLAGGEIPPVESDDVSGWMLTIYVPVKNDYGNTVCYVGVDTSMEYLSGFNTDFLIRMFLIFSGFFILVLFSGLWISRFSIVYPIGSMTNAIGDFISASDDQNMLDAKVEAIKELDIYTGTEVEELYNSVSQMASGIAEQMRTLRYYAEATAQMQNGLIITMADMVENRDSDTGAHIQKTAAYVKIILEGLKKKGYYSKKLTPKYISDVVMSAPLHDVGKINIPDAVLNKPGKLTDEEYEIMKTHTTAGRRIIENAINKVQGENYLKEALNMASYHHERWDGKGYPEGLKGEVIPLSARVMAVADVFDALASPRVYKPAFPLEKALSIIEEGAGTQFDPLCVEVFLESLTEVKQVLKKYQES